MKKFFIFAAAACVAFASCVKNEPSFTNNSAEGAQVLFNTPVMSLATKGEEIKGEVFPTTVNFAVFGYYQEGNGSYDAGTGLIELYMDEVKCEYVVGDVDDIPTNGAGTWKHETDKYYWPKNGKLTFVAASPAEDDVDNACAYSITSDKTQLQITYTAPKHIADTAKQVDVLYSNWKKDCTASTHESNEAYDGVELAFNHALSVVRLNIKAKDPESAAAVRVTGLAINGLYETGQFTNHEINQTQTWGFAGLSRTNYVVVYDVADADMEDPNIDDSRAITVEPTKFCNYLLIPQTFDAVTNITVKYAIKHKVRDNSGNYVEKWLPQVYVYPLQSAEHKAVGGSAITEWVKGTRYTYDITIGVDEIYFAPSVADWAEVNVTFDNETPQY